MILSVATGSPVAWFIAEIFDLSIFKRRPSHSKNGATALTITCIAGTAPGPSECMVVSSQNPLVPIGSDPAYLGVLIGEGSRLLIVRIDW